MELNRHLNPKEILRKVKRHSALAMVIGLPLILACTPSGGANIPPSSKEYTPNLEVKPTVKSGEMETLIGRVRWENNTQANFNPAIAKLYFDRFGEFADKGLYLQAKLYTRGKLTQDEAVKIELRKRSGEQKFLKLVPLPTGNPFTDATIVGNEVTMLVQENLNAKPDPADNNYNAFVYASCFLSFSPKMTRTVNIAPGTNSPDENALAISCSSLNIAASFRRNGNPYEEYKSLTETSLFPLEPSFEYLLATLPKSEFDRLPTQSPITLKIPVKPKQAA